MNFLCCNCNIYYKGIHSLETMNKNVLIFKIQVKFKWREGLLSPSFAYY